MEKDQEKAVDGYVAFFFPSEEQRLDKHINEAVTKAIDEVDDEEFEKILTDKYLKEVAQEVYRKAVEEGVRRAIEARVVIAMNKIKNDAQVEKLSVEPK